MSEKMLKFIDIDQKNPSKGMKVRERVILTKYMQIYNEMQINSLARYSCGVPFAKFIVL